jgi:hypothetical protein
MSSSNSWRTVPACVHLHEQARWDSFIVPFNNGIQWGVRNPPGVESEFIRIHNSAEPPKLWLPVRQLDMEVIGCWGCAREIASSCHKVGLQALVEDDSRGATILQSTMQSTITT